MLPIGKIESLAARYEEIEALLCRPEVVSDSDKLRELTTERSELQPLVETFARFQSVTGQLEDDREALKDPELAELAQAEIPELEAELETLGKELQLLLLPKDPADERDTILEIRSAAGGEEAALFAADLFRMYGRYAETMGWNVEVTSISHASAGGIKEVIAMVSGDRVYSHLRFEGGVHRVQRVPATESQGRIHTSTASVAVLPEATEVDIAIDEKDISIQRTLSGGAGGQHVNRTQSAIILTHAPSGIQIRSEEQRSQHQNLARAMQILRARLLDAAQAEQDQAIGDERRSMVGSGDRAEKIRTYNYPQNRVTDHRIQLTLHKLDAIVEGDMEELIGALRSHHQAALLEEQSRDTF
ncbi:MAG: peptide chain release factor 1 [Sandaracinus sp.]|nr:peptide chain release factor 1 [Sandaracinus sp.]|tara:strand:+ start:2644 stop:3720 length:1077 start_codon:yes stop_codon:yes gene_type:complete